tara:strand:- start:187 stop:684 length:498 start_codon:yes stop_codon:yes gene_type:complete
LLQKAKKPVGFAEHNHSDCVKLAVEAAESYCAMNGLKLTPVRLKVLTLLLEEHRALGAYAILDLLRGSGFNSQPPVAYRALDFLVKHGFVHRIERLNAFVACNHPGESHLPEFMICRLCDKVAEAKTSINKFKIGDVAIETGFKIEQSIVELEGVCSSCVEASQL